MPTTPHNPNDPRTLRPIPATIGVVVRGAQVLLVRRANPPDSGLWGFPGGKIDRGETIAQATIREIREETGIVCAAKQAFTALDAFDHDEMGGLRQHFVLVAVLCQWLEGEPVAGDDALEARWFELETLQEASLAMSFGVLDVARQGWHLVGGRERAA